MDAKAMEKYQAGIDDAMTLINTPAALNGEEKQTAKLKRAVARTRLETLVEKKRLVAELSDSYEYFDDV